MFMGDRYNHILKKFKKFLLKIRLYFSRPTKGIDEESTYIYEYKDD